MLTSIPEFCRREGVGIAEELLDILDKALPNRFQQLIEYPN
jgi:hypothetical protein